jgi:hypothetical protein
MVGSQLDEHNKLFTPLIVHHSLVPAPNKKLPSGTISGRGKARRGEGAVVQRARYFLLTSLALAHHPSSNHAARWPQSMRLLGDADYTTTN